MVPLIPPSSVGRLVVASASTTDTRLLYESASSSGRATEQHGQQQTARRSTVHTMEMSGVLSGPQVLRCPHCCLKPRDANACVMAVNSPCMMHHGMAWHG